MSHKPHIVLIGAGLRNRGAEAMALTFIHEVNQRLDDTHVTIASYSQEELLPWGTHTQKIGGKTFTYDLVHNPSNFDKLLGLIGLSKSPFWKAWRRADSIIDLSGFAMSDKRTAGRRLAYAYEIVAAWLYRKPIILFTQAFGPLDKPLTKLLAKSTLPLARMVCVRDEQSIESLTHCNLIGRIKQLQRAPDSALLLPTGSTKPTEKANGYGIVPNIRLYETLAEAGKADDYIELLCKVARHAKHTYYSEPVFIIHEEYSDRKDDLWIAHECQRKLSDQFPLQIIASCSALEIREKTASLEFIFASRYHAVVGAAALSIPFFALGWAHKYQMLAADLGVAEAAWDGMQTNHAAILQRLDQLWDQRVQLAARLDTASKDLRQQASSLFDILSDQIKVTAGQH
jgi:polysaccharide pyruvyl transferase WcaK-like protein